MENKKYINIIAEFEIKEDIKEIRIINSYEDRREYTLDIKWNIVMKRK